MLTKPALLGFMHQVYMTDSWARLEIKLDVERVSIHHHMAESLLPRRHEKAWLFPGLPIFRWANLRNRAIGVKVHILACSLEFQHNFSITESGEGGASGHCAQRLYQQQTHTNAHTNFITPSLCSPLWDILPRANGVVFTDPHGTHYLSCYLCAHRTPHIFVLLFLGPFPLALPLSCLISRKKSLWGMRMLQAETISQSKMKAWIQTTCELMFYQEI